MNFIFLHSRVQTSASVRKQVTASRLVVAISMAKKHEIKKRQVPIDEKTFWSIVAWSFLCIQNFKTHISVCLSSNFGTERGDRMVKQLHWACTARGAQNCEKCFFFWQGHHFSISWSLEPSRWLLCFTEFDKYVFFLLHSMVYVLTQNMESRKHMMWMHIPYWSIWIY